MNPCVAVRFTPAAARDVPRSILAPTINPTRPGCQPRLAGELPCFFHLPVSLEFLRDCWILIRHMHKRLTRLHRLSLAAAVYLPQLLVCALTLRAADLLPPGFRPRPIGVHAL